MLRFMRKLNNISRMQSVYRTEKLTSEGICAAHHAFIHVICRFPGYSQEEISKEICLNKSTVARVINHLEQNGYVKREPDKEDKRKFLVFPTEKMLKILPQVRRISAEWNDLISKDIPEEEMEIFHSVLSKIEQNAKEVIGNGASKG